MSWLSNTLGSVAGSVLGSAVQNCNDSELQIQEQNQRRCLKYQKAKT